MLAFPSGRQVRGNSEELLSCPPSKEQEPSLQAHAIHQKEENKTPSREKILFADLGQMSFLNIIVRNLETENFSLSVLTGTDPKKTQLLIKDHREGFQNKIIKLRL